MSSPPVEPRLIVGIDLGTTYSLVACLAGGRPVPIRNALGEVLTPSAVSVAADGRLLVGAAARARAATHPRETALMFKRDMGTDKVFDLAGQSLTPVQLSALVLAQLRQDAEAFLGHPVDEAIITVPAYFGELQRAATRDAGLLAGLRVERIINEPTAAALAYGLDAIDREVRAIVLDLGGGTFDVTVLEIMEGVIEIQATAGDARLGGEDFTAALVTHAIQSLGAVGADIAASPLGRARLYDAAERAKCHPGTDGALTLVAAQVPRGSGASSAAVDVALRIEPDALDGVWRPLVERVRGPILRALADARAAASDIETVLLVGGATRMACIQRLATSVFGRLPLRALPPDEAVVLGAAIQAGLKAGDKAVEDVVATDIAPFSMGIAHASLTAGRYVHGLFSPIIERGTVIPVSRVERFRTMSDYQDIIHIEVYQGEHSLVRDNQRIGDYRMTHLPRRPQGEVLIDVRFTYDLNGLLEVEMHQVGSEQRHVLLVERSPGRLTPSDIEAARAAMKGLKLDPREALPNTVALARAEALHAELVGPVRQMLSGMMTAFRAALDAQDTGHIAAVRGELIALTDALSRRRE